MWCKKGWDVSRCGVRRGDVSRCKKGRDVSRCGVRRGGTYLGVV